jgi:hypothetical protein
LALRYAIRSRSRDSRPITGTQRSGGASIFHIELLQNQLSSHASMIIPRMLTNGAFTVPLLPPPRHPRPRCFLKRGSDAPLEFARNHRGFCPFMGERLEHKWAHRTLSVAMSQPNSEEIGHITIVPIWRRDSFLRLAPRGSRGPFCV